MTKKLIYVGDGAYTRGVPDCDLDADDLKALPKGLTVKALLASGLYAEPKADKSAPSEKE
jgi:hypothetical protein